MIATSSITIGQRLALGFGLILALMVGVTAVGIQKVDFIDATMTEITDVNAVKQRYAINFRGSVHDRAIALRDIAMTSDAADLATSLEQFERLAAFYRDSAVPLDKIFAERQDIAAEERAILGQIKDVEKRTQPLMAQVIQARQAGQQAEAQALLLKDARPALSNWLAAINRFIDYQEKKNQQATDRAQAVAKQFLLVMVVLCGIAILAGVAIAYVTTRYLVRALGGEPQYAAQLVTAIASGDLSSPLAVSRPDSMLGAVAGMQEKLKAIFTDMVAAAEDVSRRAENVGQASREASHAVQVQAESASSSVTGIAQMTASIQEVSQIARLTEANSAKTSELSEQGARLVGTAAAAMAEIVKTVTASSEQIRNLQQRSQEVGGIANVIREIADQTNLLALNAAIEAARAGEAGRGFAVVADEVRKLAERTGSATNEISQMIAVIQSDTHTAVDAMETTAPQVEKGLALANDATAMLGEIHRQAADSLNNVREVARAAAEQVDTATGIAKHVEQIAAMSRETHQAMRGSTQAAEELEGIAQVLRDNVRRFRVR